MHGKDNYEKILPDNEIYFYFQLKTNENFVEKVASQDVTLARLNKRQEIYEFIQNVSYINSTLGVSF